MNDLDTKAWAMLYEWSSKGGAADALAALLSREAQMREALERTGGLLSRVLHELAGSASLCWDPRPSGVFDSQEAIKHVEGSIAELRAALSPIAEEPATWPGWSAGVPCPQPVEAPAEREAAAVPDLKRWLAVGAGGDAVRLLPVPAPSTGPDVFCKFLDATGAIAAAREAGRMEGLAAPSRQQSEGKTT